MIMPFADMINLLGTRTGSGAPTNIRNTLALQDVSLHLYNKKESRSGRKMGHITVLGKSVDEVRAKANHAKDLFEW